MFYWIGAAVETCCFHALLVELPFLSWLSLSSLRCWGFLFVCVAFCLFLFHEAADLFVLSVEFCLSCGF